MAQQEKEKFDFWNDHSMAFLEMSMKRDHQETVHQADGYGSAKRDCGDTIMFFLMADGDQISAISYDIKGCIYTHACANTIIHLAQGKDIQGVLSIQETDIIAYLETLPEKEHHCATLALKAFRKAVESLKSA